MPDQFAGHVASLVGWTNAATILGAPPGDVAAIGINARLLGDDVGLLVHFAEFASTTERYRQRPFGIVHSVAATAQRRDAEWLIYEFNEE